LHGRNPEIGFLGKEIHVSVKCRLSRLTQRKNLARICAFARLHSLSIAALPAIISPIPNVATETGSQVKLFPEKWSMQWKIRMQQSKRRRKRRA
jgi:hypothetical protein